MHVRHLPIGTPWRLVHMHHLGLPQQLADPLQERPQPPGGLAPHPGHEPHRHLHAQHAAKQPRRPAHRHVVGHGQVGRLRMHLRAVLGPAGHPRRRLPDAGRPTDRAGARLDQVGGHHRARRGRRDLEHLPRLRGGDRHVGKVAPAPSTDRRGAHHGVVRVAHLGQGRPWLAGLLAGLAPGAAPQRPVLRLAGLLGVGAIGTGRPIGVGRVPARPAFQLGDPVAQHRHLRL